MEPCPYLDNGVCAIAKAMAPGETCKPSEDECRLCSMTKPSRTFNQLTFALAATELEEEEFAHFYKSYGHLLMVREETALQRILTGNGPGSQLWKIFKSLGVETAPDCNCLLMAEVMNSLGVKGCIEAKDRLVYILKKNQKRYGLTQYLKSGALALREGLAFKIDPIDPLPGLLNEALRRAT